jgi:hypothetical protein
MATINPVQQSLQTTTVTQSANTGSGSSLSNTGATNTYDPINTIDGELSRLNNGSESGSNVSTKEEITPELNKSIKASKNKLRLLARLKNSDIKSFISQQPLNSLSNINGTIAEISQLEGDYSNMLEELNSLKTEFIITNPKSASPQDILAAIETLEPESPEAIKLQEHLAETSTAEYHFNSEGLDGDIWAQYTPNYSGTNGYYSTTGMISGLMAKANVGGAYDVMNQYYGGLGVSA